QLDGPHPVRRPRALLPVRATRRAARTQTCGYSVATGLSPGWWATRPSLSHSVLEAVVQLGGRSGHAYDIRHAVEQDGDGPANRPAGDAALGHQADDGGVYRPAVGRVPRGGERLPVLRLPDDSTAAAATGPPGGQSLHHRLYQLGTTRVRLGRRLT